MLQNKYHKIPNAQKKRYKHRCTLIIKAKIAIKTRLKHIYLIKEYLKCSVLQIGNEGSKSSQLRLTKSHTGDNIWHLSLSENQTWN